MGQTYLKSMSIKQVVEVEQSYHQIGALKKEFGGVQLELDHDMAHMALPMPRLLKTENSELQVLRSSRWVLLFVFGNLWEHNTWPALMKKKPAVSGPGPSAIDSAYHSCAGELEGW